jgi:hypothetical protein
MGRRDCFLLYEPASKMYLLKSSLNLTDLLVSPLSIRASHIQ